MHRIETSDGYRPGALSRPHPDSVCRIVIPVFNDWDSAVELLRRIGECFAGEAGTADVIFIDDGSTESPPPGLLQAAPAPGLGRLSLVRLRRNLGHQRALAVGLAAIESAGNELPLVVMDGDGEDDPAVVPRLLAKHREHPGAVVFVKRARRSEGLAFRLHYRIYRWLFRILTGHRIAMGNYSLIPAASLRRLVGCSELWNHYVATVLKARLPYEVVVADRAPRIAGESKMNLVGLVVHGLSSVAAFGEVVGIRALFSALILLALIVSGIAAVVAIRMVTDMAIPGWASYMVGLLSVIGVQFVIGILLFVFIILHSRNQSGFLPLRDYHWFILDVVESAPGD